MSENMTVGTDPIGAVRKTAPKGVSRETVHITWVPHRFAGSYNV